MDMGLLTLVGDQDRRSKLHPRSERLALTKECVEKLEECFDDYGNKITKATAYMRGGWKQEALDKSKSELPQLPCTGTESGPFPGLAPSIYLDAERVRLEGLEKVKTFKMRPALVKPDGRSVHNVHKHSMTAQILQSARVGV